MGQYFRLLTLQLKLRYGISAWPYYFRVQPGKTARRAFLMVCLGLALLSVYGAYIGMIFALVTGMHAIGADDLALTLPFVAVFFVVLIFGIVSVLGLLFQAGDIEMLASLPIRQQTVFAAKFSVVYLGELGLAALFVLPAVILLGGASGAGALFYIKGILAVFLLPMIPLSLAALVSLVLMRISFLTKHKDAVTLIGGLLFVALTMGFQVFFQRYMQTMEFTGEELDALIGTVVGLAGRIGTVVPPVYWASSAVVGGGSEALIGGVFFVLLSVGLFALALFISSKIYMSGATAQLETGKRRKKTGLKDWKMTKSSSLSALVWRELKVTLRTPVYALNGMVGVILFPLMIVVMTMSMKGDFGTEDILALTQEVEGKYLFVALFCISLFINIVNSLAETPLSREGKHFWMTKCIPVPYRRQFMAKLIFNASVSVVTIVFSAAVGSFLGPAFAGYIWLAAVLGSVAAVSVTAVCMVVDYLRPKLKWTAEAEAIKQNLNVFIGMYSAALRELASAAALSLGIPLKEGVYFYAAGPQFETPAEIRAMGILGADAVGMSTVTEALTAAHCGMPLLGLSLMTNMAAGVIGAPLTTDEVDEVGAASSDKLTSLIREIVRRF
ncbi:hypothetical protein LJC32_06160 [Oscillospiraceae bacterium OttesenSCG-928-F05]|nr:hypothetical protein [Oscillospiraceae bacterium OttesenSCG-928-F05]